MKKLLSVVLAVAMVASLATASVWAAVTPTAGWYESFTGNAYTISSVEDLYAFAQSGDTFAGKVVTLTQDLVIGEGNNWDAKAKFAGTFDGAGHSISGLVGAQGLFSQASGTIKNLSIVDASIEAGSAIAAFVGAASGALNFEKCYTDAGLTASYDNVAGFVGNGNGQTITFSECWFDGEIEIGNRYASGFVGNQNNGKCTFVDCLNTGSVFAANAIGNVAGFSESVYAGSITALNCVNLGKITRNKDAVELGWPITGTFYDGVALIENCYNLSGQAKGDSLNVASGIINNKTGNAAFFTGEVTNITTITADKYEETALALGDKWTVVDGQLGLAAFIGEVDADIVITTWDQLVAWAANGSEDAGKVVALDANIAAPVGATWTPKSFAGVFDGNHCSITGLNNPFINVLNNGTIKDLSLLDSNISTTVSVRGILVNDAKGTISGVYVNGSISSTTTNLGGIAGHQCGALTIENTWFDGTVTSKSSYVGGFVGNQESKALVINNCLNTGKVSASANMGAFSDSVYSGSLTISNSLNLGLTKYSDGSLGRVMGGLIRAGGSAVITNCYNDPAVADDSMFEIRGTGTLNGKTNPNSSNSTTYSDYYFDDAVISTYDGNTLAQLGSAWTEYWVDSETVIPVPAAFGNMPSLNPKVHVITSYEDLVNWAANASNYSGATVKLANDIYATGTWTSKETFAGTFDGQGHTIYGLTGTTGLIASATATAVVKNLSIENATIGASGENSKGVFAASAAGGAQFINLYTNATVLGGHHVGGIVANVASGTTTADNPVRFDACWFDGNIDMTARYGAGIIGNNQNGYAYLNDCLNTGTVSSSYSGAAADIAGLAAAIYYSNNAENPGGIVVTNCMNLGNVLTPNYTNADACAGGILGRLQSKELSAAYKATYEFDNVYSLTGAANYDAVGSLQADYMPGVKPVTEDELKSLNLGGGWVLTKIDGLGDCPVPAFFAEKMSNIITVSTEAELKTLSGKSPSSATYILLVNDITLSNAAFTDLKLKPHSVIDGNGYTITGLNGRLVANVGTVKNLTFASCSGAESPIGAVFQLIDNVVVESSCTYTRAGLVKSAVEGAVIRNTRVSATIRTGAPDVGGFIVDVLDAGDKTVLFENCVFDGAIECTANNQVRLSGFVGNPNDNGTVGTDSTTFRNCVAAGSITGVSNDQAAGFIDSVYKGFVTFENCLSMTRITKTNGNVGGRSYVYTIRPGGGATLSITDCYALTGVNGGNSITGNIDGTAEQKQPLIDEAAEIVDITAAEYATVVSALNWEWYDNGTGKIPVPEGMGNMMDVAPFKSAGTYPTQQGKLFAGWFTDASCTTAYTESTGYAYAKFVDEEIATVGAQYMANYKDSGKDAVRFVSTIDDLNYTAVGFKIVGGRTDAAKITERQITTVLSSIANSSYDDAADFAGCDEAEYFYALNVTGITETTADTGLAVTPFWITLDGTTVYANNTVVASYNFLAA